jgi:predicted metal-dependent HD superfamily phosphohydrolase
MATRHEAVPQTRDERVLIDVDLWILGAPEKRFDEYERQVREEYGWVPGLIYRRKRRAILESFVARPTIYSTERFIERYEQQARANLARSLARR